MLLHNCLRINFCRLEYEFVLMLIEQFRGMKMSYKKEELGP